MLGNEATRLNTPVFGWYVLNGYVTCGETSLHHSSTTVGV